MEGFFYIKGKFGAGRRLSNMILHGRNHVANGGLMRMADLTQATSLDM
jgi:hypothetical protein